ncbi:MAG: DUF349 domain-containing protein [Bacteroides sp.]|nr:DUF349 domain-containing protein [Bacteroides sp.]
MEENDKLNAPGFHAMSCQELLEALQGIVESGDMTAHRDVAAIKTAFYNRRNREQLDELTAFVAEGNAPETFSASISAEEVPFRDLLTRFKEGRAAFLEAEEKRLQENLEKKLALIAEMRSIAEDIDNLHINFPRFQQMQQDFREKSELPPTAETDTWKQYQVVSEDFYDKLKINKELRDLDFKKNLEAKRALIEEARKLAEQEDVIEAIRTLQTLHNSWREIGPVAKELRDEIWEEFKGYSTTVNKRHQEFFETRKAAEAEADSKKETLCEAVEAIKTDGLTKYSDWEEATAKVIALQAEWKESGIASRKNKSILFNRFRAACDAFFSAKSEFYKQAKSELAENLEKKLALCEKAEALASEENLKKAAEEATRLQTEWRQIGGVGKKHSDEIWKRFQKACNAVFDRRHKFINNRREEENANLEAKKALIERLKGLDRAGDPKENLKVVKEAQAEWTAIGHVPVKVKESIWEEFRGLCDIFYEADRNQQRGQRDARFRERVREVRGGGAKRVGGERERLQREIERKKVELKTYENNLGFFNVKSSAGNSMLKEMERRQARISAEIKELQDRLKMLNSEEA